MLANRNKIDQTVVAKRTNVILEEKASITDATAGGNNGCEVAGLQPRLKLPSPPVSSVWPSASVHFESSAGRRIVVG